MQTLNSLPMLQSNLYLWNHDLKILLELKMRVTSSIQIWKILYNLPFYLYPILLVLKPTLMPTSLPFPHHLAFSFCTSIQTLFFIYHALCYISDCQKFSHLLKPNSNTTFSVIIPLLTWSEVISLPNCWHIIHAFSYNASQYIFFNKCIHLLFRFVGCPSHFYLSSFLHNVVDIN